MSVDSITERAFWPLVSVLLVRLTAGSGRTNTTIAWPFRAEPPVCLAGSSLPSKTQYLMADSASFLALFQQQAVPETLLKKRRTNDKQREERLAKAAEARKVRFPRLALDTAACSSRRVPRTHVA